MWSVEVLSAHGLVLLTLLEHVHVLLALTDVVGCTLKAVYEVHVESLALVFLLLLLVGVLLLFTWTLSVLLLLSWCTLLLLLLGTVAFATSFATHHAANDLMCNCGTGSESHTCHHGLSKSTHHTSSGLWLSCWCLSWWCLSGGWSGCWSGWGSSGSWWSSAEHTSASSTGSSSWAWSSSSSWHFVFDYCF